MGSPKAKMWLLGGLTFILISLFMFQDVGGAWEYVLQLRAKKLLAIVVTGAAIAFATVIFQTITNNRILTPSILGLDSLYMLVQTALVFLFGSTSMSVMDKNSNFLISIVIMMLFSLVLYRLLFGRNTQNIYFVLLLGIIFGTFFGNISSFMQMLMDPNEFLVVQDSMFASFNNISTDLLALSVIGIAAAALYYRRFSKYMDVLTLGKDHAVNLGVPYDAVVKQLLLIIVVLISVSTALVGPITFLGLLVVNVAHELFKTFRHSYLIFGSILISVIALVGGQMLVERVFTFSTTLSVIVNFVGGVYFIYLLLKENKS